MKNKFLLFLLCLANLSAIAQNDYRVSLQSGSMKPSANVESFINESVIGQDDIFNGYYYRLIQFNSIPDEAAKKMISSSGLVLMDYIPANTYVTAIPQSFDRLKLKQLNVRAVMKLDANQKISNNLLGDAPAYSKKVKGYIDVVVQYYGNISPEMLTNATGKFERLEENKNIHTLTLRIPENNVMQFAAQSWVYYMAPAGGTSTPDDTKGGSLHRSNVINSEYATGRHYDGAGVKVGIADDGDVGPHIDFTGRLTNHVGNAGLNHGDMTSGICVGAGNLDPTVKGTATGADLHVFDITGYPQIVNAQYNYDTLGIAITSTSFSQVACNMYTTETQLADQLSHTNTKLSFVFSAGNSAAQDCNYGAGQGWGVITGGYKQGKNVITVASVNGSDTLEASSSRGPASDGRIKPDITANGVGQRSTDANNAYQTVNNNATSSACPAVAGVTAQLYQAYKALNAGSIPDAALIKACILNGAEDLGNAGPDYTYGWGRINAFRALKTLEDGRYIKDTISQGQSKTYPIVVPANVSQVRVMIYWNDPEGTPLASKALVNDINMRVSDAININWWPYILNPTPAVNLLSAPATQSSPSTLVNGVYDTLNNVEQVAISAGFAGTYNIHVAGFSIPSGPQTFYIVYEFRKQDITVTYPNGGEGFVPNEQQVIRWDAVKGLGAFTIDYTVNGGVSWHNITTTVNQFLGEYTWTVPDSVTGAACIRVSRSGGASASDVSDTIFTIVRTPQNLQIGYACSDRVQLKWSSVAGATSYTIYKLGAKYMDIVGTSATTSFIVTGVDSLTDYWFSVAANASNGGTGRRAIAIHKSPGTFSCPVTLDASLDSILSPIAGSLSTCQSGSTIPVTIILGNLGLSDIYNFNVFYRLNNGTAVGETITDTIVAGASLTHTFTNTVDYSLAGTYNLEAWTELPGELNFNNDTLRITTTVTSSTLVQMPVLDNFETDVNCPTTTNCGGTVCPLTGGWINAQNGVDDNIDFRVNQGGTPTNNTGPDFDHTLGNAQGRYIYLEASACFNNNSRLYSPCIDLTTASAPQLKFWYHMFGVAMGTLHVDIIASGNLTADIIPAISGDQGNLWHQAVVDLTPFVGQIITVRFRATTGANSTSDIALDDINIMEGPVAADASIDSIYSPLAVTISDCQSNSAFPVTVVVGNPGLNPISDFPVSYYVNGGTVYTDTITDTIQPGQRLTHTFTSTVDYSVASLYSLATWTGLGGDLNTVNDTVWIFTTVIVGTPATLPLSDDFESDVNCATTNDCGATMCALSNGWTNKMNGFEDNIDFRVNSGGTPTMATGPDADHTLGTAAGKYIYLEASACFGQRADLWSPCINLTTSSGPELHYWYHMLGQFMGELHVDILTGGTWVNDVIPFVLGDQTNIWKQGIVDLTPYNGQIITIRFRAITGSGATSDIALDDINIIETHTAPSPAFVADNTSGCVNATIKFTDKSTLNPTAWKWSFTPNTISYANGTTDSTQNPEVTFLATGLYDVKLTAYNVYGNDSVTITSYINILTPSSLTITENFQGVAFPPVAWRVESAGNNNTWEHFLNVTGSTGVPTDVARINNFTYTPVGGNDGLTRMEINLASTNHPVMTFDVAYRRRSNFGGGTNDTLRIDISTDCGSTYTPTTYQKLGAVLATTPTPGGPPQAFTPNNANQWRNDTLDLLAWVGQDVTIKFVNISSGGNNLYLDNINIHDLVGVEEVSANGVINIYPNPSSSGLFNLTATLNNNSKAVLTITDINGRIIEQRDISSMSNNFNTIIDLRNQSKGVYFLELRTASGTNRAKLSVM